MIILIGLVYNLNPRRNHLPPLFGDEAVYYMMAQSLAYDRNLLYERKDLERFFESGHKDGPNGIFLTKRLDTPIDENIFLDYDNRRIYFSKEESKEEFLENPNYFLARASRHSIDFHISEHESSGLSQKFCIVNDNIYYSKFLVYPLFVSVFVFFLGDNGFLLFNILLYFMILLMGYNYLSRYNNSKDAAIYTLMFFLISVSIVYTLWITPEIFNMFMVMAGFYLFAKYTENESTILIIGSSVCFAVAGASKLPNSLFMIAIGLYLLMKFKIKTIFLLALVFSCVFLSFYLVQYQLTGNYNAYSGDRKTFYWHFPYEEEGISYWEKGMRASSEDYFLQSFYFNPRTMFLNIYYYHRSSHN